MGSPQALVLGCSFRPRPRFAITDPIQSNSIEPRPGRREVLLRSSEVAALAAILHFRVVDVLFVDHPTAVRKLFMCKISKLFYNLVEVNSGTKPSYLGIQKNPPSLALCPATNNCISTSEEITDANHYAPPWNYNPEDGRRKKPINKDEAIAELLQVVTSLKPDNFTPRVAERREDYIRVEYESPIMGFVDDVEFWFPPGKKSIVEYRSASRIGNFDFDINKKRIKALRSELEKKGWSSEGRF
ncbi:hypothetical protein C4D60_Mb05t13860 [Musa balbisiana]|uniref:DUF1499 domain-containing protein n=1 Tax=Musa balbisiana TaxID=52838 RepID=A0A4S8JVZ9_MUSBA|nr:hypothetical protein C4D60_Mb05t13860 [Musa balbisiana]